MQSLKSEIPHIAFVGAVNSGKSSLLNVIVEQQVVTVSEVAGTTTDIINKRMELLDVGAINLVDTPGLNDQTKIGELRKVQTTKALSSSDFWIIVIDINDIDNTIIEKLINESLKYQVKYQIVFNKIDLISQAQLKQLKKKFYKAIFLSTKTKQGNDDLIEYLTIKFKEVKEKYLVKDLVKQDDIIVLVTPIDSEAPKKRMILPQMQTLRECLDEQAVVVVVQISQLKKCLSIYQKIKLVVTDSQAFKEVDKIVGNTINLTSFSILFARLKGDLNYFVDSLQTIEKLTPKSKILIAESCSHNKTHEDIAQIKIPKLLNNYLGFKTKIDYKMGQDFPTMIKNYDLVIHCGSCMLNAKTMEIRINEAKKEHVPMVNFGTIIAYLNGILPRAIKIF